MNISDHETNEIYLLNKNGEDKIYSFFAREKRIEYSVDHDLEKSRFIILNNNDKAIDFKISFVEEKKIQAGYEKYPKKN